jgi:hypothetical protein
MISLRRNNAFPAGDEGFLSETIRTLDTTPRRLDVPAPDASAIPCGRKPNYPARLAPVGHTSKLSSAPNAHSQVPAMLYEWRRERGRRKLGSRMSGPRLVLIAGRGFHAPVSFAKAPRWTRP